MPRGIAKAREKGGRRSAGVQRSCRTDELQQPCKEGQERQRAFCAGADPAEAEVEHPRVEGIRRHAYANVTSDVI